MSTCGTTTTSDRTEALRFGRRAVSPSDPDRQRRLSRSPAAFGVGIVSGAWFTSTTRSRHDVRDSEPNGGAWLSCFLPTEPWGCWPPSCSPWTSSSFVNVQGMQPHADSRTGRPDCLLRDTLNGDEQAHDRGDDA